MVATAVKLASKRRRGIHVHSMITVPDDLPLDAEMPEQKRAAQAKIEQAKLIGGQRVTGHVERVRPGQAGRRDRRRGEARCARGDRDALPRARATAASLYDKTLQTVLAERPCRVIIVSAPTAAGAEPARAERGTSVAAD